MSSRKAIWLSLMNSISSPASEKSACAASRVSDPSRASPSRAIAAAVSVSSVPPRQEPQACARAAPVISSAASSAARSPSRR